MNLAEGAENGANEPKEVESLRVQLKSLGLQNLVAKATGVDVKIGERGGTASTASTSTNSTGGSSVNAPTVSPSRRRRQKEHRRALTREEERKKAVENALERLRKEREERMKKRNIPRRLQRGDPFKKPLPPAARGNLIRKNSNQNYGVNGPTSHRRASYGDQGKLRPEKQVEELEIWDERRRQVLAKGRLAKLEQERKEMMAWEKEKKEKLAAKKQQQRKVRFVRRKGKEE